LECAYPEPNGRERLKALGEVPAGAAKGQLFSVVSKKNFLLVTNFGFGFRLM
jgi:hypothetical protein